MTTQSSDIQSFTLGALQAAGVSVITVEDGKAYRAAINNPDLRRVLQRGALHFTFDEEYFDIYRETDVEYVAPGYPLLDALIRMTQARFTVSEAVIPHQNVVLQLIQGGALPLDLQRTGRYRPLLRFRLRVTYKSDSYEEEIISVTVDPQTGQTLPASSANWPLHPVPDTAIGLIKAPPEDVVLKAWGIVENEIQTIVADKVARQEEQANLRLHHELSKLQQYLNAAQTLNTPQGLRRVEELKNRYRLTVKLDLIFAEVLHYPVELVTGKITRHHPRTHQPWTEVIRFEIDRFTGRTDKPPVCPVCFAPLTTLAPCDDGKHVVCPVCSTQCATCGAAHCAEHALSQCEVSGCGCGHCAECLRQCERCTHAVCPESCTVHCPDCHRTVCRDCTVSCADCLHEACEDHFQRCHITNVPLCAEHVSHCDCCSAPTRSAHLHALTRPSGQDVTLCDACSESCPVSGERFHPDDLVQCYHTKRRLSPALVVVCPGCHHPVGRDILIQTVKGVAACPSCVDQCSACCTMHLGSELQACGGDHQGQPALLCKTHRHQCGSCPQGTVYCSAHISTCAVGSEAVCRSHALTSHLSRRLLCRSHAHKCPDCQRTVATDELVMVPDRDGTFRQVCHSCTAECLECPPSHNRYARTTLTHCQCLAGQPHYACAAHSTTCHVTQKPYAASHTVKCQSCNQTTGRDQTKTTKHGKVICIDCVGVCPHCPLGTVHALTGLQLCRTCNKVACSQHIHACSDCGISVCEHHAVLLPNGKYVCTDHACSCDNCAQIVALSHTATCTSNEAEVLCPSCQTTCPSCQGTHCQSHSRQCPSCGQTYCPSCAGNPCNICGQLQASGPEVERVRRQISKLIALGLDLPDSSSSDIKVSKKGPRLHVLYTPPAKGFMASLTRLFSKPPQRLTVLEEQDGGRFKLISDREVPTS